MIKIPPIGYYPPHALTQTRRNVAPIRVLASCVCFDFLIAAYKYITKDFSMQLLFIIQHV
ncbi:hypothetical protein BU686_06510 [Staphylococcus chromogenes]|nr:hypothetical protein BU686_06510 [Staphylococcus chromogenes]